jgi:transcriptional regulator with XRE-family HTH domain
VSNFSNALKTALEQSGRPQLDVANAIGMAQSQFSRYCNGRSDVRPSILEKIVADFPLDVGSALVRAYLLDQCPATLWPLIEIQANGHKVSKDAASFLDGLPPEAREAFCFLAAGCHDRRILDFVLASARALGAPARHSQPPKKSLVKEKEAGDREEAIIAARKSPRAHRPKKRS